MTFTPTGFALSLNVPDPTASAAFLTEHFGYERAMEHDGVVSLAHPAGGSNLVLLRTGLETFTPADIAGSAREGLLIVLETDDLDGWHAQLLDRGVEVVTAPETEPWGERFVQYRDPNGLVVQLVQWV